MFDNRRTDNRLLQLYPSLYKWKTRLIPKPVSNGIPFKASVLLSPFPYIFFRRSACKILLIMVTTILS